MKRVLIIVGVLVLLGALTVSAFAGGVLVGRVTSSAAQPPTLAPPTETLEEASSPPPTDALPQGDDEAPSVEPTLVFPTPSAGEVATSSPREFDYELLQTVLDLLEEQFYGELPDAEDLTYGAIRGMLLTLDDPYTSFIDPDITAVINEDATGEFEGIGAFVTMREDGYLEIASLMPGQPAEAAGVKAGDIIVAVGDTSIVGLGLYEAISYIRGPEGTMAELEILRPGEPEPLFINVIRARIEIPIIESEILDNGIAYLRLTEFDANADDRVEEVLEELLSQQPKALIFDLRDNPGGWLNQAISVADLFLDQGLVAIQRDSLGGEQRFTSRTGDLGEEIPMVVLVNRGSASASEIVAGALQDRGRAPLIGTQTLGKGSVQLPNNLDNGAQLRITIARWYTPNEQELHGSGLMPDVEALWPSETAPGEDPQLQQAIDYLIERNYEIP
jgi:carboxyl-terminal processing protease